MIAYTIDNILARFFQYVFQADICADYYTIQNSACTLHPGEI